MLLTLIFRKIGCGQEWGSYPLGTLNSNPHSSFWTSQVGRVCGFGVERDLREHSFNFFFFYEETEEWQE